MHVRLRLVGLCLCLLALAGCVGIKPPKGAKQLERSLVTTGYCKCGQCCGWKRNWFARPVYKSGPNKGKRKRVGITANGSKAAPGTIAADTSRYPFGTVMYIPGYGYGKVEDIGGAINGDHIDLFFKSHKEALAWGKEKKQVKIWKPK